MTAMSKKFHIIIKVTAASVSSPTCPILVVLKEKNKKDPLKTDLVFEAPGSNVFHRFHESASIGVLDSLDFHLVSENKSDTILLDCVEVVDLETKQYDYFPCQDWITSSKLKHEMIPFTMAGKAGAKKNCFEIIQRRNRQFCFRLRGTDSEIVAQSKGYQTKASAIKAIQSIQKTIPHAVTYDLTKKK